MDHIDTLVTDRGKLTFHFKLHTPSMKNEELPAPAAAPPLRDAATHPENLSPL